MLEVVEGHEHVGDHQRHVGDPEGVRTGLWKRLDCAHEVVAEEADGAAGERRSIGDRRLAVARDLLRRERVGIAVFPERPAQDRARAKADERVAPDATLLG